MTQESPLEDTGHGLKPTTDGWFIVNVADTAWRTHPTFGGFCNFEGEHRFPHLGINIHTLAPDQPACLYHSESAQEAFLVLSGECKVIVEGEERPMKQWDFFYAPPNTRHLFVGAGDGPCAILMTGARGAEHTLHYPVEPAAAKHGASAEADTPNPAEAYARFERSEPSGPQPPFAR